MERTWNSNEKIARAISGLESDATYFAPNVKCGDELYEAEARHKYNQTVDDYVQRFDDHAEMLNEYAKSFNETMNDMEIKAIGANMIVYPFKENPFQRIKTTESGIIIDLGGLKPTYKSNETGDIEEEEQFIHVGTVFDAGPDCKYIQDGDVIMWTKPSEMPIPFYKQDFVMVPEVRVMCVINQGLTERFNNLKK